MTSSLPAPAVATTAPAMPKIIGKALYLELVNNPDLDPKHLGYWYKNAIRQVIIMPEHLDEVGNTQPAQVWERVVSAHSPRSQWNNNKISRLIKKATPEQIEAEGSYHYSFAPYTSDEYKGLTDREKFDSGIYTLGISLKGLLLDTHYEETVLPNGETERTNVAHQAWVLRDSKPVVVEITDEDASLARSHTTPQAVIRRIQKARVAVGFPEKLV